MQLTTTYPFAVRLIGFDAAEAAQIAATLTLAPSLGPAYFALQEDSLQDPDLYIANGSDLRALATLAAAEPGSHRPALLVGDAPVELPHARIARPLDPARLFGELQQMIDQRAEVIAQYTERGLPEVPDRRRRKRPDFDLTDPAVYIAMRKTVQPGAVLIVDRDALVREHLARLMAAQRLKIEWTDSAATALRLCDETGVSLVLVNTATAQVDPYDLCAAIKGLDGGIRIAVVLLVSGAHPYDPIRARAAGVRGMLDTPVADRHLSSVLKRLLSLPA
jgi:CheY-like chemotaxis protein